MAAARVDLTVANHGAIWKGASWAIIIAITNPNGTPKNLSRKQGKCQIRRTAKESDTTILAEPVVTNLDAPGGKLKLSLTSFATDDIPSSGANFLSPSKYVYDVELTDLDTTDGSADDRVIEGFIEVVPGVTR